MKKTLQIIGIIAAIILLLVSGCAIGKRNCTSVANTETTKDTVFVIDTDTFNITKPGKVRNNFFKEEITILDTAQLDSLRQVYEAKVFALSQQLEFYKEIQTALEGAGVGSTVVFEEPHYDVTGESLSTDGKATIKWSITVTDSTAIVPGDSLNPNPRFYVAQTIPVEFNETNTTTGARRNAIGVGMLAGFDGDRLNGYPIVKLRIGKTEYLAGRDLNGKMWLFGIARELQFGKRR